MKFNLLHRKEESRDRFHRVHFTKKYIYGTDAIIAIRKKTSDYFNQEAINEMPENMSIKMIDFKKIHDAVRFQFKNIEEETAMLHCDKKNGSTEIVEVKIEKYDDVYNFINQLNSFFELETQKEIESQPISISAKRLYELSQITGSDHVAIIDTGNQFLTVKPFGEGYDCVLMKIIPR